ncbi:MAG: hypothetical protein ABI687_01210 [Flavitalea sp.]
MMKNFLPVLNFNNKGLHGITLCFCVFSLACHPPVSSEKVLPPFDSVVKQDAWRVIGFGGGGNTYCPTVSPHNPNFMMISCDMTGSYLTRDGGQSWKGFNIMGPVRSFVYDPSDSNTIYALSAALFKTSDRGRSWNVLYPASTDIEKVASKGDEANETIVTRDRKIKKVMALAVDPSNSNILYAAILEDEEGFFCTSTDRGMHWIKENKIENGIKNIYVLPASPANDRTILVTGRHSVWQKKGGQWKINNGPAGVKYISQYDGGFDSVHNRFILYAISGKSDFNPAGDLSGIYYSENGGQTWENRQEGALQLGIKGNEQPQWRCIGTSAKHPETVYLSYSRLMINKDTASMGVAKSTDYGKTWTFSWKDMLTPKINISAANYTGGWIDERFDPMWGENPFCFGVSPNDPSICYTTDYGRVVKTINGGADWIQCYTKKTEQGTWTTTGIDITTGYGLVADPFDSAHLFLPTTDIGLMESADGGASWKSATKNNGVPEEWVNTTYSLNFDPEVKGKAWATMSVIHDLPRTKMFREHGILGYKGGILLTVDGCKSWLPVSASIGEAAVTDLMMDASSAKNERTLYACVFGKGVYKSDDDGHSWKKKNNGLAGKEPFAWRIIKRPSDGVLFLIVSRRSLDGSIGNSGDGAVYRSDDGAESWKAITLPEGTNGPTSILIDPDRPERILLSAWGRKVNDKFSSDTGGGIFLSEDDGKSWTNMLPADQHIHDLTADNRNKIFYACGFNSSAYRSANGGKNWQRIKGYDFKWGKRVDPDPLDVSKIYISTFGGGVWYGPSEGDPNARENLFSPPFHP